MESVSISFSQEILNVLPLDTNNAEQDYSGYFKTVITLTDVWLYVVELHVYSLQGVPDIYNQGTV